MQDMKLLLVDDESRFLTTTVSLLARRGIDAEVVTNGIDALEFLDKHRVDVVILDVRMPGMDGIEVLRKIKQRYPLIEVIMLTGHASAESAVEGLKLGAFDYLMKPCEIEALIEKAREAYAKKAAVQEKIRKAKIDNIISHPMAVFNDDDK